MILVLLGTQNLGFKRLLDAIQKEIDKGIIKDHVIVQAGSTRYQSNNMEIFNLIGNDEYKKLVQKADLIIAHGGVGSIMDGITNNKKVIAVARLKQYNEHVNDHQLQIIEKFSELGYIYKLTDINRLEEALITIRSFVPRKFKKNNAEFVKMVGQYINQI